MSRDTILFDINETVLDLSSLKPLFAESFGSTAVTATWFSMLLHSSNVCALTSVRSDFGSLAGTMLDSLAARMRLNLTTTISKRFLVPLRRCRASRYVPGAEDLKAAGYRTIAFTNSSIQLVTSQIASSGLTTCSISRYRSSRPAALSPTPRSINTQRSRLIDRLKPSGSSPHDWDTHGALSAGMKAGYIDRTGAPYHPQYPRPDAFAKSMTELVAQIIKLDGTPD